MGGGLPKEKAIRWNEVKGKRRPSLTAVQPQTPLRSTPGPVRARAPGDAVGGFHTRGKKKKKLLRGVLSLWKVGKIGKEAERGGRNRRPADGMAERRVRGECVRVNASAPPRPRECCSVISAHPQGGGVAALQNQQLMIPDTWRFRTVLYMEVGEKSTFLSGNMSFVTYLPCMKHCTRISSTQPGG